MLEIKKYPDPVLKQKAETVKQITPEIRRLISNMKETMRQSTGLEKGIVTAGLAANQVGVLKRIIVVNLGRDLKAFLNPQIVRKSRRQVLDKEGCLSLPGLWLDIKRPEWVEIKTLNEKGLGQRLRATGFLARVFQHEIDHLDGILFFERLPLLQRWRMKRKLGYKLT